ncbi:ABC transporter ATP-binding protein [Paraburkholderia nemoris]|uniref:Lipopolysaccharide export system ATP-binding protein LptB n=1 Tax=Paraburkholderia nemoris TaxID=2793076 RepID=A0ABM8SXL8_9BURK|nr:MULTISPECIES: ABC transporter ATP-binding protein [Paraburkholderia]MBK3815245.1 ABC transporter ATP-binding protein [Paraburkholderia aspalathi]CAE6714547.1 Lipopolysaccharide export system ATP-binding protein LptB [Paraburkholderia nemoris]CAE6840283.1 Lipopolysaccharide export system ATP-binding protein LptB [Paraburkholderia nemoris]
MPPPVWPFPQTSVDQNATQNQPPNLAISTAAAQFALRIVDVRKSFGGVHALNGVSFDVIRGGITGLIGPNGAGKTTLFDCVAGMVRVDSGAVLLDGRDIARRPTHQISRSGLVKTFQQARGFPRMTVFEHLMVYGATATSESLFAGLLGNRALAVRERQLQERALAVAKKVRLSHVLDHLATDVSGGQRKLLEIGRALMASPRVILLDEPMAGVNPSLAHQIGTLLKEMRDDGITILLIEHDMSLIESVCDDVVVMAQGRHLTRGSFEEVTANEEVQTAYLGMAAHG